MKIERKFYVGAESVMAYGNNWAKKTIEEAVKEAKQVLEEDPRKSSVNIVKIVKVVRRASYPIIVEDVT